MDWDELSTRTKLYQITAAQGIANSNKRKKRERTGAKHVQPQRPAILEGFPTRDVPSLRKWWTGEALTDQGEAQRRQTQQLDELKVPRNLYVAGIACLRESDPRRKALRTLRTAEDWHNGKLAVESNQSEWDGAIATCITDDPYPTSTSELDAITVPDEPSRSVVSVKPEDAPSRKGDGNHGNTVKYVHSFCHIESVAIDLSWDMVCRFGFCAVTPSTRDSQSTTSKGIVQVAQPREFLEDWIRVAEDEARHFLMWDYRLITLNSSYGSLVTHTGLWDSAQETSNDVLSRLAVEHMTLEARGLDVATKSFARFQSSNDTTSADMLEGIYTEEVTHVNAGMRWFQLICEQRGIDREEVSAEFHKHVRRHFRSDLKPPFNVVARERAGMSPDYYLPLASPN